MCFAVACEDCITQFLDPCDLATEFEPSCVKLVREGYERVKRSHPYVTIYGAIEESGLWQARSPFGAVHSAGTEATEEEWHDSLIMRNFMNTEGRRRRTPLSEVFAQVPQEQ